MVKYFKKTHYELAKEHLESAIPTLLVQDRSDLGIDPTYQEFCNTVSTTFLKTGTTGQISHYLNICFHMYHMKKSEEQIYYITPELSARLAQTECNSDTGFLKSPYREIYIQIDPGLFYINDLDGTKNPVNGFYVYLRNVGTQKHIRVMACALLKSTPEILFNDSNFYFHIEMDPGKIKDQLAIYLNNEIARKKKQLNQYDKYKNVDHLEEFAKFVFNSLLYITSKKPDMKDQEPFDFNEKLKNLKSKTKKRKTKQQIEKATSQKIIIVGSYIKDKNNDMEKIKKAGGVGKWKLGHKIRVASHWRIQWYGSKKNDTRYCEHIWVNTYEKGPEFAEIITSKHVVK